VQVQLILHDGLLMFFQLHGKPLHTNNLLLGKAIQFLSSSALWNNAIYLGFEPITPIAFHFSTHNSAIGQILVEDQGTQFRTESVKSKFV
jgi:hypothetical protein